MTLYRKVNIPVYSKTFCIVLFFVFNTIIPVDGQVALFELVYPANNEVISKPSIPFSWEKISHAQYYELKIFNDISLSSLVYSQSNISSDNHLVTGMAVGSSYYWYVTAHLVSGQSITSEIRSFNVFNPTVISGNVLWLIADSVVLSGNNVEEWKDQSSNAYPITQTNTINQPVYLDSAINQLPVIRFDGVNDYFSFPLDIAFDSISMITVFKKNQTTNTGMIVGKDNSGSCIANYNDGYSYIVGNSGFAGVPSVHFLDYSIFTVIADGLKAYFYLNSGLIGTGQSFSNPVTLNAIGQRNNSQFLGGDIAELILYNNGLSSIERSQIENYLRWKYAPEVNLGSNIIVPYGYADTSINAGSGYMSYNWSNGQTSQIASIQQTGQYSVTVTDIFGYTSTDEIFVFYPDPMLPSDTILCLGDTLSINVSPGTGYYYEWSNGSNDSVLTVFLSGNYFLTITDSLGNSFISDTFIVMIDSFPIFASLGNDTSLCSGNRIELVYGNGESNLWPDGSTGDYYIVDTTGIYWIITSNSNECIANDSIYVTIVGKSPVPVISVEDTCSSQLTHFVNTSFTTDGSIIDSFYWDFGDSTYSTEESPTHSYSPQGTYQIHISLSTDAGCSSDTSFNVIILPSPNAEFSFLNEACTGFSHQFYDQSTTINSDTILSWYWDFGDSTYSTQQNPLHIYNQEGIFDVVLTILSGNNCTDTIKHAIQVHDSLPIPDTVSVIFPPNGLIVIQDSVVCHWNVSPNASIYKIETSMQSDFISIDYSNYVNGTNITIPLSGIGNNYWRIKAYNQCLDSIVSSPKSIRRISPDNYHNVLFWLIADEETNGTNEVWDDLSSNEFDLFQNNPLNRPMVVNSAIDTFSVMRFDGINDSFSLPTDLTLDDSLSLILVFKKEIATNSGMIIGDSSNQMCIANYSDGFTYLVWGSSYNGFSSGHWLEYKIFSCIIGNNEAKLYLNKSQVATLSTSNFSIVVNSLGQRFNSEYLKGDIAEVILANRDFTDNERSEIENYLHNKYAPPVSLGPDIQTTSFCPLYINASNRYRNYHWNTTNSNPADTTSSISVIQSGLYSVTVTDIFGFTSTDAIHVSFPKEMNDTIMCVDDSIQISAPVHGSFNYLWSNGQSDEHSFYYSGGLKWIEMTDEFICTRRDSFYIFVDSISLHASLGPDTSLCSGNFLTLAAGQQEAVGYSWAPGGETSSSILLNSSGNYAVTVTSTNACTATDSIYINIQGVAPVVAFTTTNGCFGDSLVLFDASYSLDQSNIVQWDWAFHDGQLAGDSVVKKKYPAPGVYPVTLTVTTDSACSSTATLQVQVYHLPEPAFEWTNPCSGKEVEFINNSTVTGAQLSDFLWVVNGNDSIQDTVFTYVAGAPGNLSVYLNATSSQGCSEDTVVSIEIKESPVAQFDVSPSCSNQRTYFFDLSESPVYHPIMDWSWDLGVSGIVSEIRNPDYTYSQPGNYQVVLRVKSLNGCEDDYEKTVAVSSTPVAGFNGSEACMGTPVVLADTSIVNNGYIYSRKWTIENAGTFTDSLVTLQLDTGYYSVTLEVVSELNCKDNVSGEIVVHPLPEAGFAASTLLGAYPLDVNFTNTSDSGSYNWDFGDGNTSALFEPEHTFEDTGSYTVLLQVTDSNGCMKSANTSIRVVPDWYDLAVLELDTLNDGNAVKLIAILANLGTLPVDTPQLVVTLPNSQPFTETVNLTLQPGTIHYYIMSTGLLPGSLSDRSYACAKIQLPEVYGIDRQPMNDEQCLASGSDFRLLRIYPNPATHTITVEFSPGSDGEAELMVHTLRGQKMYSEDVEVFKGMNRIVLNIESYSPGVYFITFRHTEGLAFGKFVKVQ